MEVQLVMFKTDGTRREFPLKRESLVVGRTSDADLRIPLPSVSRKHCEFTFDGQVISVRDLGSSNGTVHNNMRVAEAVLGAGDRVDVGPVSFFVIVDGQPENLEPVHSDDGSDALESDIEMALPVDDESADGSKVVSPAAPTVVDQMIPQEAEADSITVPEYEVVDSNSESDSESASEVDAEPAVTPRAAPSSAPPIPAAPASPPSPKTPAAQPVAAKPAKAKAVAPPPPSPAVEAEPDLEDALSNAAAGVGSTESDSPTGEPVAAEFEDPISALEALAAAEDASNNAFASFLNDEESADGKKSKS